jgi:hypothetical protein
MEELKWSGPKHIRKLTRFNTDRGSSSTTHTRTVTYQSKETYINEARVLWNKDQGIIIGPGTFNLPFSVCDSSQLFELFSRKCWLSFIYSPYRLIKTGMLHQDHKIQAPLQVNKITDINIPRLLMQEAYWIFLSRKWCWVHSKLESHRLLYRSKSLPLTVSVVNGSSRRIKMRVSIQRFTHYYAQGHAFHDLKTKVVSVTTPDIAPHSEQLWI